jgi:hypothetical protein
MLSVALFPNIALSSASFNLRKYLFGNMPALVQLVYTVKARPFQNFFMVVVLIPSFSVIATFNSDIP